MSDDPLETISGYYMQTSSGEMLPSSKLKRQDEEREEAMQKVRAHRTKALDEFSNNTVLICGTDIKDRLQISENLKKDGYVVFVARNASECEKIMSSIPLKAIILDVDFPGVEIIKKISGNGTKLIISGDPNIVRSAFPDAEAANELDKIIHAVES